MNMRNLFLTLAFGLCSGVFAQNTTVFESPIMGWSSWNTYRVHINDTLNNKASGCYGAKRTERSGLFLCEYR